MLECYNGVPRGLLQAEQAQLRLPIFLGEEKRETATSLALLATLFGCSLSLFCFSSFIHIVTTALCTSACPSPRLVGRHLLVGVLLPATVNGDAVQSFLQESAFLNLERTVPGSQWSNGPQCLHPKTAKGTVSICFHFVFYLSSSIDCCWPFCMLVIPIFLKWWNIYVMRSVVTSQFLLFELAIFTFFNDLVGWCLIEQKCWD